MPNFKSISFKMAVLQGGGEIPASLFKLDEGQLLICAGKHKRAEQFFCRQLLAISFYVYSIFEAVLSLQTSQL